MVRLGVNIDHVATLRELRRGNFPEPALAAITALACGADSIVVHLREDRRHIKENDLLVLKKIVRTKLNLEMSLADEIVKIACEVRPHQATLVPEKRQELTTEGGLDVIANLKKTSDAVNKLKKCGIQVSLFIDPDKKQIIAAKKSGAKLIELHTGRFADAKTKAEENKYFNELKNAAGFASSIGLKVFAGHGLNYDNVQRILRIKEIEELNIGYSIICKAVMLGLGQAVKEMKRISNSIRIDKCR